MMRLRRLDLTRYGKFTDYTIDFGEHGTGTPDLHIVYGLNEAGKSTALSAYLDLLFGIEERTRYAFLHQGRTMEIGGRLEFGGNAHELKRLKQRSNSLLDRQDNPVGEALLSAPLAGLSREAYRMMFSLDDETLEQGGNAILESKGDLGELLFSASAGLAGISAALAEASRNADEIFRKRASSTMIAKFKHRLAELKSRREEIDMQASAHATLMASLKQAEAAYEEVVQAKGRARARHDEIARLLRAQPIANELVQVREQLHAYADLPRPPQSWAADVMELIDDEIRFQTRLAGLNQQDERLHAELKKLNADERVLAVADRLDRLSEASARYSTAEEDLPKRKAALAENERIVSLITATLGKPDVEDAATLLVPAATLGTLRDLIAAHSGVEVARQSAMQEYEAAARTLDATKAAQTTATDSVILDAALTANIQSFVARLRQGDLAAGLRLAELSLPLKKKLFDDAIVMLHPSIGDGVALRRIKMPDQTRIEAWRYAYASLEKRRTGHIERSRDLVSQFQETGARIDAIRDSSGKIGDDDAHSMLAAREQAWEAHLAQLDRKTAGLFEKRMREMDAMASARLAGAQELSELRTLTTALAVTKATIDRQEQLLKEIDAELQALRDEIRAETPDAMTIADDASIVACLGQLDHWREARSTALSAWDALLEAEQHIAATRDELETERQSLAKALVSTGIEAAELSLPALLQAADNLLADQATVKTRQADAGKRLRELERELADRKVSLEVAEAACQAWRQSWSAALDSTWFAGSGESVATVRERIEALSELPAAVRIQTEIRHRIDAMERDRSDFALLVAEMHASLGEAFDGAAPLAAARALARRHEEARQILAKRQDTEKSIKEIGTERRSLSEMIALHDARRKAMLEAFKVETLADVRTALDRCAERDRLEADGQKLGRLITGELNLASLEEAQAVLAGLNIEALQREHAELAARLEDIDERTKELYAEKSGANDRLNAIGGDDAVARLEAERRTVLLEIEDLAGRFLRLKVGGLVAEHALRAYRDKHRSAMMTRASEAFRVMTRDEYSGLTTRPEKDTESLIGLPRQGGSKSAVDMSKGTRFQLYLALRLAGYQEFAALRPPVPFIADDIMETFDEPRSEEVFRLLGQMASVGQVIYLTHHRHLCDIARQVVPAAKIHEIS